MGDDPHPAQYRSQPAKNDDAADRNMPPTGRGQVRAWSPNTSRSTRLPLSDLLHCSPRELTQGASLAARHYARWRTCRSGATRATRSAWFGRVVMARTGPAIPGGREVPLVEPLATVARSGPAP